MLLFYVVREDEVVSDDASLVVASELGLLAVDGHYHPFLVYLEGFAHVEWCSEGETILDGRDIAFCIKQLEVTIRSFCLFGLGSLLGGGQRVGNSGVCSCVVCLCASVCQN